MRLLEWVLIQCDPVLIKRGTLDTDTVKHPGRTPVNTKAEPGVVHLQTKEHQQTTGSHLPHGLTASDRTDTVHTLILAFWSPEP